LSEKLALERSANKRCGSPPRRKPFRKTAVSSRGACGHALESATCWASDAGLCAEKSPSERPQPATPTISPSAPARTDTRVVSMTEKP
jgi:hypothetical protein